MAGEAVMNVPFSEVIFSVAARQLGGGCVQARDLVTHPIAKQLQERFL
jgi:hypothetical protein